MDRDVEVEFGTCDDIKAEVAQIKETQKKLRDEIKLLDVKLEGVQKRCQHPKKYQNHSRNVETDTVDLFSCSLCGMRGFIDVLREHGFTVPEGGE